MLEVRAQYKYQVCEERKPQQTSIDRRIYNSFIFKTCQVVQESININYFLHLLAIPIALARQVQWALDCLNYTWFYTPAHQVLLNISTVLVKCLPKQGLQVFGTLRAISSFISV